MENIIILAVLFVVIGSALLYIRNEKKRGRCIGCPAGGCSGCKGCGSGNMGKNKEKGCGMNAARAYVKQ